MKEDRVISGKRAVGKAFKLFREVIDDVGFDDEEIDKPQKLLDLIDWIQGTNREGNYFHIFSHVIAQQNNVIVIWKHYIVGKDLSLRMIQTPSPNYPK